MDTLLSRLACAGVVLVALPAVALERPGPLVDADWLATHLDSDNLVVLDIRNRIDGGSHAAFRAGHIPGARYSNYLEDGWRVPSDEVVGMTPPVAELEALIGNLGIGNDDLVVIVGGGTNNTDIGSAARVYWTFNYLGHEQVAILDGGYQAWTADDSRPVDRGSAHIEPSTFTAAVNEDLLIDTKTMASAVAEDSVARIDARPPEQYSGAEKHPEATAFGHIPGAVNIDQSQVYNEETGQIQPLEVLQSLFAEAKADDGKTVVSYCNTGHWASTNWFVMSELLGQDNVKLYDASMVGWTKAGDLPVEADVPPAASEG